MVQLITAKQARQRSNKGRSKAYKKAFKKINTRISIVSERGNYETTLWSECDFPHSMRHDIKEELLREGYNVIMSEFPKSTVPTDSYLTIRW